MNVLKNNTRILSERALALSVMVWFSMESVLAQTATFTGALDGIKEKLPVEMAAEKDWLTIAVTIVFLLFGAYAIMMIGSMFVQSMGAGSKAFNDVTEGRAGATFGKVAQNVGIGIGMIGIFWVLGNFIYTGLVVPITGS